MKKYLPEIRETLLLGLPIIFAQLGVILMAVTDNILVGRYLGAVSLGAAGLANSLSFLMSSIGVGGLTVVSAMISQAHAQSDHNEVVRIHQTSILVALILGLVLGFCNFLVGSNLEYFGQEPEITALARPFNLILSLSLVPLFIFIAIRQFTDGLSMTLVAMLATFAALLLNALLNYLLINGYWGLPKMGLNGSATATLIARFFLAAAMFLYIHGTAKFKKYQAISYTILRNEGVDIQRIIKNLKMVVLTGFQFFFEIAAFSLAVVMIGWLGKNQLAAHQIAINLASTTYMMATGIAAATAIRVGKAYGQGSKEAIFRAGTAGFIIVIIFMGACCILFLTANDFLVSLYLKNNESVTQIAISLVILGGFFQLSDGIQVVALGALRGITDVNLPTFITLIAYWVIALPLSYYLGFVQKLDVTGVWIALSLGLTFSAFFLTFRFYFLLKKWKQK